ncbi:fasciclin domain-containing protein [Winogradskyella forsetii]|uniref:fasciclin domain-containing protein n=1 Tax=Winogradskyella forsetii TaxID=2686077 RepID=UPI0015BE6FCC|nr:fasciclin domain-containing protein [Winogradskyella forsetii]
MKTNNIKNLFFVGALMLISTLGFSQDTMAPLAGVDDTKEYKTIDLIYMDKDLSIFANLLTLSGLDASLKMTDKEHTLFVPTNEAFKYMTVNKFAELTNPKNRAMLVKFVNNHFISSKIESYRLTGTKILDLGGENKIEIAESGNTTFIGGAKVIASNIEKANGLVYVVNDLVNISE